MAGGLAIWEPTGGAEGGRYGRYGIEVVPCDCDCVLPTPVSAFAGGAGVASSWLWAEGGAYALNAEDEDGLDADPEGRL